MKNNISMSILALASTLVLSIGAAGCTSSTPEGGVPADGRYPLTADYVTYSSTEEIVDSSDAIVEVKVISSREEIMYPEISTSGDPAVNPQAGLDPSEIDLEGLGVPITVTTVEVVESLKGNYLVGQHIDISQVGGSMEGAEYYETSTVLISEVSADTVLLLLSQYKDFLEPITPELGVQTLEADGTTIAPATSTDGQITTTDLDLTLPDLESLINESS